MRPPSQSLWGPRLPLLLFAAWGAWAEERQCTLDSECGYREECRKAVVHGVLAAVKTCQCHHYVFAEGHEPRCIAYTWRTALATLLMMINFLPFFIALTQYRVAYREHMTDPPLRLGETRLKRAISLRTLFLAFSTLAALSAFSFNATCVLTLFAPVSTHFFYHHPLSPIQLGASLHALGAASAFMVIVCIWVRVAAKLHDPASSTKKALYQLAFALDGSGIGLYLAVFFALPAGVVVMYFNLKGDWDRAFIGAASFVGCGLILTSLAAKLLVARQMHQYDVEKNGPRPPMPRSWAFCCLRRDRLAPPFAAAGPVEDTASPDPETGDTKEEKTVEEAETKMECERRRRALQGDVAASVASEPFMSTFPSYSEAGFKDEDRRAVTGRGGGRSGDTEKSCDDDAPRSGDQSRRTQASSSWSQGQDVSGAAFIELRVRIIQWEAATLGKRVISTAAIGILLFVFAMPYGPWQHAYLVQWAGLCFGGMGLVVANANCLCYISPAVRRNVRQWANGRNPFLSCIAVLLWRSHA